MYNIGRIHDGINNNPTAFDRIKDTWNENPMLVIGVATAATAAVAKLIDAVAKASNTRVWKKEVDRRRKLTDYPKR